MYQAILGTKLILELNYVIIIADYVSIPVENNILFFNFKGCSNVRWKKAAVNREEWTFVIKKGKDLRGLSSPAVEMHPRTSHKGPEEEYRYSSTLSLTLALDGGGWSTQCPSCFTARKELVPIVEEARWTPGPVWTGAENLPHWDTIPRPSSL